MYLQWNQFTENTRNRYTEYKSNLILAKPIAVLFMSFWFLLLYFFPLFEATSEDIVGSIRKPRSQISSQKGVPLLFHLVFIILPHQRKKKKSDTSVTGKAMCRRNQRKTGWRLSQERRNLIVRSLSTESNGHIKWSWVNRIINSSVWNSVSSLHVIRGGQGWKGLSLEPLLCFIS